MTESTIAELYLSFAGVFHRPTSEISVHLEELIELWADEITESSEAIHGLRQFCLEHPAGESRLNTLWEHYIPLFETGPVEASPYASVYLGEEELVMGQEALAVQAFYQSAGYGINEKGKELPDHLTVELEFMALLARDGEAERLALFLDKHLLPFLKKILPRVRNANRPVYSAVASLLESWLLNLKKEGDSVG